MKFFATCPPGLEPYLAREMKALSLRSLDAQSAGIAFDGDLLDLYRANLWLRIAGRIQAQVGMDFLAESFARLRKKASQLPWERFLQPGGMLKIRVESISSRLRIKRTIAEQVEQAIAERMGTLPPRAGEEDTNVQVVAVHLVQDRCTVRVDSSGEHLYRRGYKLAVAKAPLRETLAAGMLLAVGWDGRDPLLDPFCGAGTIPIEAALIGLRIPPGVRRSFQFQVWPGYDETTWQELLQDAESRRRVTISKIIASDRDMGAMKMAKANAARAGVANMIDFSQQAISSIDAPDGLGWVVTNPPYGERITSNKDLRNLYARFGDVLRAQCPGWRVAVLCNEESLLRQTRLRFEHKIALNNGGIDVQLAYGSVGRVK